MKLLLLPLLLCGCAMNSHSFKETATDGTVRELTIRTYSTWPATTELGKQRTSMGKTFSVGTSGLSEDGGSTNIAATINALTELMKALPR